MTVLCRDSAFPPDVGQKMDVKHRRFRDSIASNSSFMTANERKDLKLLSKIHIKNVSSGSFVDFPRLKQRDVKLRWFRDSFASNSVMNCPL